MQFQLSTLLAIVAIANAQGGIFSSLTAAAGSAVESKASTALTGAAASYTGPGSNIVSSAVSSGIANPSAVSSVISKANSAASGAATSTAAANHNHVAQAGLGAVVVAGLFGMAA